MKADAHSRYIALDALRGVAALMVVFLHAHEGLAGLLDPKSGYLAVDLFFLLSGFVIANAYDRRLAQGWGTFEFLKVRLIRLYPLYLLALMIGVTKLLILFRVGVAPPSFTDVAIDTGMGLLMLPSPTTLGLAYDPTFPINIPAWSLFFELIMNLSYAVFFRWLSRSVLLWVVSASGIVLLAVILAHGSDLVGHVWRTILFGLPRAAFPFFLGVLLHRLRLPLPRLGAIWIWGAAVVLFCSLIIDPGQLRAVWDLSLVFVLFPVLVTVASAADATGITGRVSLLSGELSYALYVLHLPSLGMLQSVAKRLAPNWHSSSVSGPIFILLVLVGCWLADRLYDLPIRRWLSRRIVPIFTPVQSIPEH